jgi:hypothetical protein
MFCKTLEYSSKSLDWVIEDENNVSSRLWNNEDETLFVCDDEISR